MELPYWATFSQDHSRFACASRTTYLVCQTDPFKELYRGETSWLIDMVELFNFSTKKHSVEGAYDEKVCRVRLQKDCLVVALERKIDVLRAADFKLAFTVETPCNMSGLCATNDKKMLAYPGMKDGEVCIKEMGRSKETERIAAHTSPLASLGISMDGKLIVTASVKGTLVRVFETGKGTLLREFRRGMEQADIYSVCFSSLGQWLLVSSSKGTIHLFSLRGASNHAEEKNGFLGRVKSMMGLAPGKSFAQLHLSKESASLVGFGREGSNTILVFQLDGSFSQCRFDPLQGGEMVDDAVAKIISARDRLEVNACFESL